MKTVVIRTNAIISKAEYILDGFTMSFNPDKYNNSNLIRVCYQCRETVQNYAIRSFNGPLTFSNGSPVENPNIYTIGDNTIYEYTRPTNIGTSLAGSSFKATSNVTRVDVPNNDIILSLGISGNGTNIEDYVEMQYKQIVYTNKGYDGPINIEINYCDIDLNINDCSELYIKELQCSHNKGAFGNIASLINSSKYITAVNGAGTKFEGNIAILFDAIGNEIIRGNREPFNLQVSLANTNVTVSGSIIRRSGAVVFSSDGSWDASTIL